MNFAGFVDSLGIMVKGLAIIFGVMLVVWVLIAAIRKVFK